MVSNPAGTSLLRKNDSPPSEYRMESAWIAEPESEAQAAEVVRGAAESGASVAPRGGGTKDACGQRTEPVDIILSLKRMSGVTEHSAGDLTVTALSGTPLHTVQQKLREAGQFLPLDPAWDEESTIGGIVNANASGPKRAGYGSVRDLLIASRVVYPDGQILRTGAKVVKNVAGYDMNKLFIGSMGTLGIHTEFTFKIRPIPPEQCLLALAAPSARALQELTEAVLDSSLEPVAFEWINREAGRRLGVEAKQDSLLLIGFADVRPSVEEQIRLLRGMCETCGVKPLAEYRGEMEVEAVYGRLRSLVPSANRAAAERATVALKFMGLLSDMPGVQELADARAAEAGLRPGTSGGLLTGIARAVVEEPIEAGERIVAWIRAMEADMGKRGVRMIVEFAPKSIRRQVSVWGPPASEQGIMNKIKQNIDPQGLFNPGRLSGGL